MKRMNMFWTLVCTSSLLALSCATAAAQAVTLPRVKTAAPTASAPASKIAPRKITTVSQPAPKPRPVARQTPLSKKIGMIDVSGVSLDSFLGIITRTTGINFITAQDIKKERVTAKMQNITAKNALDVLLKTRGLAYEQIEDTNVYVVFRKRATTPSLTTNIIELKYISLIPNLSTEQKLDSILAQSMTSSSSNSSSSNTYDLGMPTSNSKTSGRTASAKSAVGIVNVIRSLLSKEYGDIQIEPRTNSLIVTDLPERFASITYVIEKLDVPAKQVKIEVKMTEVDSDYARQIGLDWGNADGEFASFKGPVRGHSYFLRQGFFNNKGELGKFFTGAADLITPGELSLAQLQVLLKALVTKNKARFLNTPSVITENNTTAVVATARNAALSVSQTVSETLSTADSVERALVGVKLSVTPQINGDSGYITLLIQPSYSDIVQSLVETSTGPVFDPVSRGVSTQVRVKSGESFVIGGLISSSEENVIRKVPLFGSIPILGWLFRSESISRKNTQLIIVITPTILED